ncbi:MAG: two-component regulator propeller domain-containing protein, partial [Chitinophagaceae bacterium]
AEDGGLTFYEPAINRFSHYRHDNNNEKSLSNDNARCVFEDDQHLLWIGSDGGGLNLFDKKTQSFTRFRYNKKDSNSLSSDNVVKIFQDSRKRLWIGTVGGGLNLFDRQTGKFHRFLHSDLNPNTILSNVVFALCEDGDGNIWIGTENGGVSIYNPETSKFYHYLHDEIDNESLSHNSVYDIYRDIYGSMWVGTFAGGLNIFNPDANRFIHYKHTSVSNSLSHNNVLCMAENNDGKLWIGTDGGGLNLFDPITKEFRRFLHEKGNDKSICGNYVLSVCQASDGNLWIGTWADGVTVYNPKKDTYQHFKNNMADTTSLSNNNAWVIIEDHDKNIWVGTYNGGLNLYNPATRSFTRFDNGSNNISSKKINSITEDSHGNLWLSTDGGGIEIFNKKTKTFTHLFYQEDKNSLSDNRVNYIYENRDGNLWISTMAGLNFYNTQTKSFTVYTTANGLPNNVIFGLLEDDKGYLWISTNKGLSRFNPRTATCKNFDLQDGLQSYEFKMRAFCKTKNGAMYFGGINGFNEFFPGNIKERAFDFPLVFTNFEIFNKKVPVALHENDSPLKKDISETKDITLPYSSSVITFEFASLSFSDPEKQQYAYKLDDFDKQWIDAGSTRTATYTNLDPGTYVFMVRRLNSNGAWSSPISLNLTISPPFWLTWWFRVAVLLVIAGSAVAFYKARINAVKRQRVILEEKVARQTIELTHLNEEEHKARVDAEKAREETNDANESLERKNQELEQFVYIASHDLREPLRTTTSYVELFRKQYGTQLDEKANKYLMLILQSSERMRVLITDLLDYSRLGNDRELQQVDCNLVLQEVLADLGIALNEAGATVNTGDLPVINAYTTGIKQLFQNLIANGIKFRKKDIAPQLNIQAIMKDNCWQFSVADNGIGMQQEHTDKIFNIFQRLHTRKEYEGSGIGLAHCKK